jgi:hypothetical protein
VCVCVCERDCMYAYAYVCAPARPFQVMNQVIYLHRFCPNVNTIGVYPNLLYSLHSICSNELAAAQEQKWDVCGNKSSDNVQLYFYT